MKMRVIKIIQLLWHKKQTFVVFHIYLIDTIILFACIVADYVIEYKG